jgi:hypothetical protein
LLTHRPASHPISLPHLPNELIHVIIDFAAASATRSECLSLCLVSKATYDRSLRHLYRCPTIKSDRGASSFIDALAQYPSHTSWVESLTTHTIVSPDLMASIIYRCPNIHHLAITLPQLEAITDISHPQKLHLDILPDPEFSNLEDTLERWRVERKNTTLLNHVTHLQLVEPLWEGVLKRALEFLPSMTHLAFPLSGSFCSVRAFQTCNHLNTLVLILPPCLSQRYSDKWEVLRTQDTRLRIVDHSDIGASPNFEGSLAVSTVWMRASNDISKMS